MSSNIGASLSDVNANWSFGSMFEAFVDLFRPVCKVGEMYSLDQATARMRVGDATIRAWEAEDLIDFVAKYSRLDKTD
jgi:hypothetical protein